MNWPQSTDYFETLQHPQLCLADAELRLGQVATTDLGLPRVCSGNFADVYQLDCPGGAHWAVKCFTRSITGLKRRYEAVSRLLQEKAFAFTVPFHYLEQGIRIGEQWFPVVKMRWIDGLTLNEFVRTHLDRPRLLEELLRMWWKLARQLDQAGMAHADLQHGNVLLVPTASGKSLRLTLIDYDGSIVPELLKVPSGEFGHPNYQHPRRAAEGAYRPEVDRFSHLVVCCALCALVRGDRHDGKQGDSPPNFKGTVPLFSAKDIWDRYDNGDNLLFRKADFEDPGRSKLFQELWQADDKGLQALAGRLALACRGRIEEVLPLESMLSTDGVPIPLVAAEERKVVQVLGPQVIPLQKQSEQETGALANTDLQVIPPPKPTEPAQDQPWWVTFQEMDVVRPALPAGWGPRKKPTPPPVGQLPPLTALSGSQAAEPAATEHGGFSLFSAWARFWDSMTGQQTLRGHGDCVLSVTFSPDGRLIASTSRDRTIKIWYLGTGQELVTLSGHAARVNSAVFNPAGTHIVSGSDDKTIKIWDISSGREIFTLRGHNDAVYSVAFHPDGRRIASGSFDKTVRIWDLASRREIHNLHGHIGYVYGIAFGPDGGRLVSGGFDQIVKVWDADAGREIWTPRTVGGPITSVAFSPDGHFVASGSRTGLVEVWDAHPGRKIHTFRAEAECVLCVAFSPDGRWLVSGDDNKLLRLWDVHKGRPGPILRGHADSVSSVAFSPDGKHIVSGSWDAVLKIWDTSSRLGG